MLRFIFSFALLLSFLTGRTQEKPLVMASASMWADMAENLGGDLIDVQTIVPVGGDPHIYDPTPDDARRVEKAELVLVNGLTFEGWILELVENSGTKARTVMITEGIAPIQSMQYENATDPHAWMDPTIGLKYIENIYQALLQLLPEQEDILSFNYKLYKENLQKLDEYCTNRILEIPENQRILITSHDAFQYYGRKYGLRLEAVLGTSTESDVQTSDVRRIEEILKKEPVPAIFIESTINPKMIQQLADDHSVVVGGQLYADSLGDEDSPASTYETMIKHNTDVIVDALKKARVSTESNETSSVSMWYFYLLAALVLIILFFLFNRRNA